MFLPEDIGYIDVSPRQMVSVATSLVPFLEHDDAQRALMGANMQRQAVPLLRSDSPLVGTGMEATRPSTPVTSSPPRRPVSSPRSPQTASSSCSTRAERRSTTSASSTARTRARRTTRRSSSTPVSASRSRGHRDGPATENGELALGKNLLVAFMTWEGYNFEDAIILSQDLVKDDTLSSIHIEEYEVDARDTKLGKEEITRDLPNVSPELLKDLDERGIIRIGAEVRPGDILVGKVTPKGETELSAEERLLRAIFNEKSREVRDTSLKVPHGEQGTIIAVKEFNAEDGDDELGSGVNRRVVVYIAQKRKITEGDKLAGRHGNKGVIAKILPIEDMPFMADGTPVDIVLNPLGIPGRMNFGQVLETTSGGSRSRAGRSRAPGVGIPSAGAGLRGSSRHEGRHPGVRRCERGGDRRSPRRDHPDPRRCASDRLHRKGQMFDGRSGEPFPAPISVGYMYILKLHHLVDDKIHARSTGPYSMITQQSARW